MMVLLGIAALSPREALARLPAPAKPAEETGAKEDAGEDATATPWGVSLAASASASSGKDTVSTSSLDFKTLYDSRPHQVNFNINAFFSIKNSETNADRTFIGLEYRNFWTKKTFAYGQASAEQNQQQNLTFRTTWVGGLGYKIQLHENPDFFFREGKFALQGGAGYQYQDMNDPEATAITHRWILQSGITYNATLTHQIVWNNRFQFVFPPLDFDEWRTVYVTDLTLPLFGNLSFLVNLTLDYLNGPVLKSRGSRKLTSFLGVGLSYSFGSLKDR